MGEHLHQPGIVGRGQRAVLDHRGESGHLDDERRVGWLARSDRHVKTVQPTPRELPVRLGGANPERNGSVAPITR